MCIRDRKKTDHVPGVSARRVYGDIGIVYMSPVAWNLSDKISGVLYINSENDIVLAHQKDLIKMS